MCVLQRKSTINVSCVGYELAWYSSTSTNHTTNVGVKIHGWTPMNWISARKQATFVKTRTPFRLIFQSDCMRDQSLHHSEDTLFSKEENRNYFIRVSNLWNSHSTHPGAFFDSNFFFNSKKVSPFWTGASWIEFLISFLTTSCEISHLRHGLQFQSAHCITTSLVMPTYNPTTSTQLTFSLSVTREWNVTNRVAFQQRIVSVNPSPFWKAAKNWQKMPTQLFVANL